MGERTELPSERRLQEARERGQVARSTDLAGALDLCVVLAVLFVFGGAVVRVLGVVMKRTLEHDMPAHSVPTLPVIMRDVLYPSAVALAPILTLVVIGAMFSHISQFGLVFSTHPLSPRLDRLSPIKGIANLFARRNVVRSAMGMVKLSLIAWVGMLIIGNMGGQVAMLSSLGALAGASVLWSMILRLALWLLALLLALGVVDLLFQRWQHSQDLRMTRQEVQDERRSMEGDPLVKGRRMRMMRQIALQRINQAVPRADVVVTNPTHYSVAIEYDQATMHAPRVIAKGADFMAMRIRQVAAAHSVPIVERPPLARALFAQTEVGREISPELYQAVAEVLAYVYKLERTVRSESNTPSTQALAAMN
jgi:flagellar biosynthetic protein FlhB